MIDLKKLSEVPRELLELLAVEAEAMDRKLPHVLADRLDAFRAALTPKLRTRAEVASDALAYCKSHKVSLLNDKHRRLVELADEETRPDEPAQSPYVFPTETQAWQCLERFFGWDRPDSRSDEEHEAAQTAFRVVAEAQRLLCEPAQCERRHLTEALGMLRRLESCVVWCDTTQSYGLYQRVRDVLGPVRELLSLHDGRRAESVPEPDPAKEIERLQRTLNAVYRILSGAGPGVAEANRAIRETVNLIAADAARGVAAP